ncbi:MAG: polyprenyl synthetase family protein [Anaerolineaceae bacterium]|nr:polyprenyl synthetase family protein [Anaerolineaceae bacterium]MBN2677168.1 polyprenyl synthetase family protein [Anaerolineaceae bacterium]
MPEPVYTRFLSPIEDALREHWSSALANSPLELQEMIAYHMGWQSQGAGKPTQGKRLRPALILLVVDACGRDWIHALPAAVAVEYLHNFSLIHDDIQDHSTQRHGRDTLWVRWGIPQAINTGDAMFTLAFQALLNASEAFPTDTVQQLLSMFSTTCLNLTEGQHLDMCFESQENVSESAYLMMISGKTASLLGCCTGMGAILGLMNIKEVTLLKSFGVNLGLAFQIQDDILGIWGKQESTGKSSVSDLASGKKTLPILHALNNSSSFKETWHTDHSSQAAITKLMQMLDQTGSRDYAQSLVRSYTQSGLAALEEAFRENPKAASNLACLADQLLNRDI